MWHHSPLERIWQVLHDVSYLTWWACPSYLYGVTWCFMLCCNLYYIYCSCLQNTLTPSYRDTVIGGLNKCDHASSFRKQLKWLSVDFFDTTSLYMIMMYRHYNSKHNNRILLNPPIQLKCQSTYFIRTILILLPSTISKYPLVLSFYRNIFRWNVIPH